MKQTSCDSPLPASVACEHVETVRYAIQYISFKLMGFFFKMIQS